VDHQLQQLLDLGLEAQRLFLGGLGHGLSGNDGKRIEIEKAKKHENRGAPDLGPAAAFFKRQRARRSRVTRRINISY
jgi:hypothetical protein